jgi:hypothetical protein
LWCFEKEFRSPFWSCNPPSRSCDGAFRARAAVAEEWLEPADQYRTPAEDFRAARRRCRPVAERWRLPAELWDATETRSRFVAGARASPVPSATADDGALTFGFSTLTSARWVWLSPVPETISSGGRVTPTVRASATSGSRGSSGGSRETTSGARLITSGRNQTTNGPRQISSRSPGTRTRWLDTSTRWRTTCSILRTTTTRAASITDATSGTPGGSCGAMTVSQQSPGGKEIASLTRTLTTDGTRHALPCDRGSSSVASATSGGSRITSALRAAA